MSRDSPQVASASLSTNRGMKRASQSIIEDGEDEDGHKRGRAAHSGKADGAEGGTQLSSSPSSALTLPSLGSLDADHGVHATAAAAAATAVGVGAGAASPSVSVSVSVVEDGSGLCIQSYDERAAGTCAGVRPSRARKLASTQSPLRSQSGTARGSRRTQTPPAEPFASIPCLQTPRGASDQLGTPLLRCSHGVSLIKASTGTVTSTGIDEQVQDKRTVRPSLSAEAAAADGDLVADALNQPLTSSHVCDKRHQDETHLCAELMQGLLATVIVCCQLCDTDAFLGAACCTAIASLQTDRGPAFVQLLGAGSAPDKNTLPVCPVVSEMLERYLTSAGCLASTLSFRFGTKPWADLFDLWQTSGPSFSSKQARSALRLKLT